jgi:hypothetical protein
MDDPPAPPRRPVVPRYTDLDPARGIRPIVQMIPAGGWRAVYDHPEGYRYTMPLVGFALHRNERNGFEDVAGFDLEDNQINFVDEDESFVGYHHGKLDGEPDPPVG